MVKRGRSSLKKINGLAGKKKKKTIQKLNIKKKLDEKSSNHENDFPETSSLEEESDGDDGFSEHEDDIQPKYSKPNLKRHHSDGITTEIPGKIRKPHIVGNNKMRPPTLEEINELKETQNLFHSNIFRLQVNEMISELKIKDKYQKYINNFLERLRQFVRSLKQVKNDAIVELENNSFKIPINLTALKIQNQTNFQFHFIAPTKEPFLLGAAATQTLLGPKIQADFCIIMPSRCFQKGNNLNLIYDRKRALYLTLLAQQMLKCNEFSDFSKEHLKFNFYNNNPLKPILEITPPAIGASKLAGKLSLRLFVAADSKTFKMNRFVPWNSNIRSTLFDANCDDDMVPFATPAYNANVLFDLTIEANHQVLTEVFTNNHNFQEGLILLKVWMRQRQFGVGYNTFTSHILAMLIVYLFRQKKLNNKMSSYQVARNVWNYLAFSNWNEPNKGITLFSDTNTNANQPTMEQMHAYYDVVFLDVTGFHNLCSQITVDMYKRIRLEAKLALDMLNDIRLNSFQYLFMTKYPFYSQFDHIVKINQHDALEQILEMHVTPADKCNYAGYIYPQLVKVITSLLYKGLKKRIRFLLPLEQATAGWSVDETPVECMEYLHLGLILDPDHAFVVLEKGPESIDEKAVEFRDFWGKKAQLRRFQDGTITESVIWASSKDEPSRKRLIVQSIILHLLQRHFQLESKDIDYVAGQFDIVFKLNRGYKMEAKLQTRYNITASTDAEALSVSVIKEFDNLARKLNQLKDLPLEIVLISGISPVLRFCEPAAVLPIARTIDEQFHAIHVQHGVIQLGLSGKWPNDLTAFRAIKVAFYIKISLLLEEKYKLPTKVTYDGILVLTNGYCFQLEIAHPKEIALLKKDITDKGVKQFVDCPESIALEKRYYILPKVATSLKALHQTHTAFGPSVILAKSWLFHQLIDDGLWPEECTELLIARQFLKITPQHLVTNCPQMGFIRFLQLLAFADWKTELFLINFNNLMDEAEIFNLEQKFSAERDSYPPLCIVTSYDQKHYGAIWSSHQQPSIQVLARVVLLAKQALTNIESTLLSRTAFIKPLKIFMASSEGYDLVIQCKPELIPNSLCYEFPSAFVQYTKPNWRLPLAGTNFLKASVQKLREAYGEFAAFFFNPLGGKEIGVIWKPQAFQSREFKVNEVTACSLTEDEKQIQVKRENLIEDFKLILQDFYLLIDSVDAVRKDSIKMTAKNQTVRYFNIENIEKQTLQPMKKKTNSK